MRLPLEIDHFKAIFKVLIKKPPAYNFTFSHKCKRYEKYFLHVLSFPHLDERRGMDMDNRTFVGKLHTLDLDIALCSRNFQIVKLRQHGVEILQFDCNSDFT